MITRIKFFAPIIFIGLLACQNASSETRNANIATTYPDASDQLSLGMEQAQVDAIFGEPLVEEQGSGELRCAIYAFENGYVIEAVYDSIELVQFRTLEDFGVLICDPRLDANP